MRPRYYTTEKSLKSMKAVVAARCRLITFAVSGQSELTHKNEVKAVSPCAIYLEIYVQFQFKTLVISKAVCTEKNGTD